jgi:hypothetical protein
MPVRLANDPYQYVRRVKGGKWQARPYDDVDHRRINLGLYPSREAAAGAIRAYWRLSLESRATVEKPRFVRPVRHRDGTVTYAVVIPTHLGTYTTADAARNAAVRFLLTTCGPLFAPEVLAGREDLGAAAKRAKARRSVASGQPAGRH